MKVSIQLDLAIKGVTRTQFDEWAWDQLNEEVCDRLAQSGFYLTDLETDHEYEVDVEVQDTTVIP